MFKRPNAKLIVLSDSEDDGEPPRKKRAVDLPPLFAQKVGNELHLLLRGAYHEMQGILLSFSNE